MKKHITTITLIILSFVAQAQDTLHLTLDECRNKALSNSESVKIADATIDKAKAEKMAAFSAWLPNVSVSATGIYSEQDIKYDLLMPTQVLDPTTGELVPNIAINPMTGMPITNADGIPVFNTYAFMPIDVSLYGGAIAGVSAEQALFAGGRIITGNKMAKLGTQMAQTNKQLTKSQLTYNVDKAYYTYLSVKEKVILSEMYLDLLKELVAVVENSYNAGMTNRNDLLKVKVKYNDASLQLQKAKNGLELSRMALCQVIGVDFSTTLLINDRIQTATYDSLNFSSTSAYDRTEYKLLKQQLTMAEQQVKMTRGEYLPTIGVSANYSYYNIGIYDMDNYDSQGFSALVNIKIPITTFGEGRGKVKSAQAEQRIAQMELQQTSELLQLEIEQAKLNVSEAYNRIAMTEEALSQAHENVRISKDSYDLGVETIVNLLEAQTTWQKAYSDYIDAITEYKIAECNFLRVTNQLN
jgi:outer membrane protein TolC